MAPGRSPELASSAAPTPKPCGRPRSWWRRSYAALSAAVAAANAAPGPHPTWHFVSDIPGAFVGHGYCSGVGAPVYSWWAIPRYLNTPVDSVTAQGDIMGTMHPNDLGYSEIGAILARAIVSTMTAPAPAPATMDGPAEKVCLAKNWVEGCE